jgi:hypothetical protein
LRTYEQVEQASKTSNWLIFVKLGKEKTNDYLSIETQTIKVEKVAIIKWKFEKEWVVSIIET